MLSKILHYDLVYMATPYSKYPSGIECAFREAAAMAARLIKGGAKIYSPIAHTHPIAIHGKLDPLNHSMWLPFDETMMRKSDALLVVMMPTWDNSFGIAHEIGVFKGAGKPVHYLCPETFEID